jgi:hypothetical protein
MFERVSYKTELLKISFEVWSSLSFGAFSCIILWSFDIENCDNSLTDSVSDNACVGMTLIGYVMEWKQIQQWMLYHGPK